MIILSIILCTLLPVFCAKNTFVKSIEILEWVSVFHLKDKGLFGFFPDHLILLCLRSHCAKPSPLILLLGRLSGPCFGGQGTFYGVLNRQLLDGLNVLLREIHKRFINLDIFMLAF